MEHVVKAVFSVLVMFGAVCLGAEAPKADENKIVVYGNPEKLATIDIDTKEVTYEKGVKPEDVMSAIVSHLKAIDAQAKQLAVNKPKDAKDAKAPAKKQ